MGYELAIGDRMYSSWSLRGWLMFDAFGISVRVRHAFMGTPQFGEMLQDFPPAKLVPAMRSGDLIVWESMAIAETLHAQNPDAGLMPRDQADQGMARSMMAEMHSGFGALRSECPMNLRHSYADFQPSPEVLADLARLELIWSLPGKRDDGPFLFGAYSAVDAFFAPVAMRIAGYGLPVGPAAQAYVNAHLHDPSFRRWRAMAFARDQVKPHYDKDLERRPWPGPTPLRAEPVTGETPINARCPYSNDPVMPDALARIEGKVIGFCNSFCRDKSVADPQAWPLLQPLLASG